MSADTKQPFARLKACPSCHSSDRKMTMLNGTANYGNYISGTMFANVGMLCLHGWHDYPYLARMATGHYGTRRAPREAKEGAR